MAWTLTASVSTPSKACSIRPSRPQSGGLDLVTQSKAPRYPSYRVDGHSAYAQLDWKLTDALTLSGGARRQQMDVDVGVFKGIAGGSNDYAVNLFNLGAIYDFPEWPSNLGQLQRRL
jgi:outer membrane receptor protein involved in Fe transport